MKLTALAPMALAGLMALPAQAETFRLSTHGPEAHPLHHAIPNLAELVNTNSETGMEMEAFMSAALAEGRDTLKVVKSGVAQGGLIVGAYVPSDLPLNSVLNSATISVGNQVAAALAMTELGVTNQRIMDEWKNAGAVFGAGFSTPPLWLYCTKPVTRPEQFTGLKTWATSGTQSALIAALGGVPVNVSVNDVYSGLQRGSLDCASNDPSGIIKGFRWGEIANNITMMPMGLVMGGALYAWNIDFWNDRTPEEREFLFDQMAQGLGQMLADYQSDIVVNVEGGREAGASVVDPEPSFVESRDAFNEEYVANIVQEAMDERGLEDPQPVLDEFMALFDKWEARVADMDLTDAGALAELVRTEIYDKVDATSYGVDG